MRWVRPVVDIDEAEDQAEESSVLLQDPRLQAVVDELRRIDRPRRATGSDSARRGRQREGGVEEEVAEVGVVAIGAGRIGLGGGEAEEVLRGAATELKA